jgi:hypothetical protein
MHNGDYPHYADLIKFCFSQQRRLCFHRHPDCASHLGGAGEQTVEFDQKNGAGRRAKPAENAGA